MKNFTTTILISFAALRAVLAQVTGVPGVDCGGATYTQQDVQEAADAALNYIADGSNVHKYPHQEYDYEGFTFDAGCNSPYYEFPIFSGHAYTGGSPGADRVVIGSISSDGSSAVFCSGVTHTGGQGSDFTQCSETGSDSKRQISRVARLARSNHA